MTVRPAPAELLAEYASGAATGGVALLVATHLTYSPEARAAVGAFEAVGGAFLADETPAPLAATACAAALDALDRPCAMRRESAATGSCGSRLPRPLGDALPWPESAIPWSFRLPGVSECPIPGFADEEVSLLRVRPGASIPQHTHDGTELTLVLTGAMADGGTTYAPGEIAVKTETDDHRPRIVGRETCMCLVVLQGSLRFTGRFSRALNLFAH